MFDPVPSCATVQELISYPVKGCAGVRHSRAAVTPAGLAHDRSFMVVDPAGSFRSQRSDPRLATIRPRLSADGTELVLSAPGAGPVRVAVDLTAPRRDVFLFGAHYRGIDQGDPVAGWLSQVLGAPRRLVRVPPEHDRVTTGQTPGTAGYADGGAIHLLSRSSLDLLNARLLARGAAPLPASRFRPNLVVSGWATPHTEDRAARIHAGTVELAFARPTMRCLVTTIDQSTGRAAGPEPLRVLAAHRRVRGGLAFGVYFAVTRPGEIAVGDRLVADARMSVA